MTHHLYKNGVRDKGIIELRTHGCTYKEIGVVFSISGTRVIQIIAKYYRRRGFVK
jgi:DNA-directed RNA polymerase specialized sigma subunit